MNRATPTRRWGVVGGGRPGWWILGAAFLASAAGAFLQARQASLPATSPTSAVVAQRHPGARVGLWVQERTILTPEGVQAAVAMARRIGADALFVQVLARGEAAYRSSIWPAARPAGATSSDGGPARAASATFDPLAAVLQEARREPALEVHAWINAYTWGELGRRPDQPGHPLARHPEWVTVDASGRSLWEYGVDESPYVNALFVDPGVEGVRQTVVETVQELVRRYDLDGIHLDYVRYPWSGAGYHPQSLATFWGGLALQEVRGPQASPLAAVPGGLRSVDSGRRPSTPEERAAWNLFRARQVTLLVERVAAALRAEAPDVELTVAVFPEARRAYEEALQEWPEWLARGLVSGLVLMSYTPSDAVVREWVQRATALARGTPIYAGIGAYLLSGRPDQLRRQSLAALEAGASGIVYYSFESLEVEPSLVEALAPAGASSR